MDVLGSASFVLQSEALTQNRLATDVNALATGLRVRSAADDPSGYTIAQNLQSKAAGLQQSVTNVQTANNLLNVADGALSNIESILQRIRSLVVEANSDINSQDDLENLQAEINEMLLEINKIGSETSFNGLVLFNGQFTQGTGVQSSYLQVFDETAPFPNEATNATGSNTLANGSGSGLPGVFAQVPDAAELVAAVNPINGGYVPAFTVFSIVSASNNMIDPDTNTDVGPGVLIQEEAYSLSNFFGPTPLFIDYSAIPDNAPSFGQFNVPAPSSSSPDFLPVALFPVIFGSTGAGTFSAADVGAQFAVLTENPAQAADGHALSVNDGGEEGTTVSVSLPQISTTILNISNIDVTDQALTTIQPITQSTQVSGISSSNVMNASYAEIVVDQALQTVNTYRAQIGAQVVATQIDATNATTTSVNETASASNITDANIGATVTDFTKQQILNSVGMSVLAQLQVSTQQLTALLLNSFGPALG
ncbi:MAG TPA: flagellin [Verrucomicrobiae bacterium]|nr:flagellin [Verrucomicrobiae bacterium]